MFFRDFSKTQQYKSTRTGTVAGDPHVVDLRALRNTPDGLISYKLTHSDEWQALPRSPAERSSGVWSITKLYKQPLPIKKKKKVTAPSRIKKKQIGYQTSTTAVMIIFRLNRHDVRIGRLTGHCWLDFHSWRQNCLRADFRPPSIITGTDFMMSSFWDFASHVSDEFSAVTLPVRLNRLQQHSIEDDWCSLVYPY